MRDVNCGMFSYKTKEVLWLMQLASQMQKDGSELVDCSRHSHIEYSDLKATNRSEFGRKSCDAIDDRKCTPTGSWEVARMEQKVFNHFALRSSRQDLGL